MRRREHDVVHRRADQAHRQLVDLALQFLVAGGVALARFGEHHHALGAAGGVGRAEHRHAAAPHAGEIADRLLELVGADVAAAADDDVLLAPGDVEPSFREIGAIAGVDPLAVEQRLRGLRVAVVAGRGRWAAELKLSLVAVGKLEPGRVDHAQVVIRDCRAAGHDLERRRVVGLRRFRLGFERKILAVEHVDAPALAGRREGEPDRRFGEAIHRRHHVAAKALRGEALLELRHRVRAHRLGAVEGETP